MSNWEQYRDDAAKETPVRGFLHRPAEAAGDWLVLTHGAGANCNAPVLVAIADAFCASGLTVLRCDLPFRQLRPTEHKLRAGCFSAVILTEEGSHLCWQQISPGWSMLSCCCPTHCIHQSGLSSCAPRTSLTCKPRHCS
jgi:hypothetical protein